MSEEAEEIETPHSKVSSRSHQVVVQVTRITVS